MMDMRSPTASEIQQGSHISGFVAFTHVVNTTTEDAVL